MSNDTEKPWMTAREAAKLLRVTERMIGHYANDGKLGTYREGRRVWYSREDVEKLAQTLRADLRPTQLTTQDVNSEMMRYVRNREEADRRISEAQQALREGQQELTQGQREMLERLDRIERQVKQRWAWWQIALVVLAIVVVVFILARVLGV